jgi:hypothetical protein
MEERIHAGIFPWRIIAFAFIAALLLALAAVFTSPARAEGAEPDGSTVTIAEIFPDPVLADWVAGKLGMTAEGTPTVEQLAGITDDLISGTEKF